jgi:predicted DNA-binding ribbon-helix-helix protein
MRDHASTQSATSGGKPVAQLPVVKRSIVIAGHKTSVSLEDQFWTDLRTIAREVDTTLSELVGGIDKKRDNGKGNLSSAIRVFVLEHWRNQSRAA